MMSRTSSLSAWVILTSSLRLSIRKSSSYGDPSLTYLFFLSFCFYCFFIAPYLLLFFDVSEIPLIPLLPEKLENYDSEYADVPDIES
jgi:hypothetical protein